MSEDLKSGFLFGEKFAKINNFLAAISAFILLSMVLTISYDVIARYVFGAPTKWSLEINEYCLLAVVYLSGAWTLRVGGHVRVDILFRKFSKKTQLILELINSLLGMIFTGILTWEAACFVYDGILTQARSETYLEVLQWPIRSLMFIGFLLVFIEFLLREINFILLLRKGGYK